MENNSSAGAESLSGTLSTPYSLYGRRCEDIWGDLCLMLVLDSIEYDPTETKSEPEDYLQFRAPKACQIRVR
jgi:hypothetical protein